ncbi:hypothetical protein [Sapientia aquatica]|uniref:Uncharacterized protein n=1 Tax=Sapientia aquatica TaxID=1549640 RepID=A0A4R5W1T1_9BURK|nr:hypothetical protein [Sapientia aquatica]TDK66381.1 hypothetical protein E2I14_07860 [Sapientia aquatica]
MANIKVENYDPLRHPNYMAYVDDEQYQRYKRSDGLIPYKVCLVDVCGFQFIFHSILQMQLCLEYYSTELQPSSRLPVYTENLGGDHYETQRWYEKLPGKLLEKSKRAKVIGALKRAIDEYKKSPGASTCVVRPNLWDWSGKKK